MQPNYNETGTYFWTRGVKKLLRTGEAVIVRIGEKYYRVLSFQESDNVMTGRVYSNITVETAGKQYTLFKTFLSGDVIHLRYDNSKIKVLLNSVLSQYEITANSVNAMMQIANNPKFKLKVPGQLNLVRRGKDGENDKKITKEEYTEELRKLLESESLAIITESNGIALQQLGIQTATKAEELVKIKEEIDNATAEAYDIPQAVFGGNITEKSDATNEFITYAVGPIAEAINDELTAKLVGEKDYTDKKERVMVWLARFKHVDVVDSANNLDKLRSNSWTFDEIREMVGYPALNTEFSQARALTKNYTTGEEDNSNAETS